MNKNMKIRNHGVINVLFRHFLGETEENHGITQSRWPFSGPRFQAGIWKVRSRVADN